MLDLGRGCYLSKKTFGFHFKTYQISAAKAPVYISTEKLYTDVNFKCVQFGSRVL